MSINNEIVDDLEEEEELNHSDLQPSNGGIGKNVFVKKVRVFNLKLLLKTFIAMNGCSINYTTIIHNIEVVIS